MKIAIVGTGSSYNKAPFNTDWKIWTICGLWNTGLKFDEVYEVHSLETIKSLINGEHHFPKEKFDWMLENVTVCHPTLSATIKNARVIDFEGIMDVFGDYFSSSISWIMAEAILQNPKEIAIYGVTMSSREEYGHQKPALCYLIGWARAKGIKVHVETECELMSAPYIYGMQDTPDFLTSIEKQKKRIKHLRDKSESEFIYAKEQHDNANGYLECLEDFENNFYAVSRRVK